MPQKTLVRPREVTVAAVVALVGSTLFLLASFVLAGTVAIMLLAISRKYPGINFRETHPDFREIMQILAYGTAIPLVLGLIGIVTGRGLLRMRRWARQSAIIWSITSSLLCFFLLAHPQFKSGVRLDQTPVLMSMLFLFPVNAWWLFLFFRPEIKSAFAVPGPPRRVLGRPQWLRENFMAKLIIIAALLLLFAAGAGWILRRNSPMREIERSRDALATVKSWHFHTVRYISGQPPETIDTDTICPSFQHRIASFEDVNGTPQVRESIRFFGVSYNHVGGQWLPAQKLASQTDPGIFECSNGPMSEDANSLLYSGILEDGTVKRGEMQTVNGESCRAYDVSVPTPHDPAETEFHFTVCIGESDHLPRETRRIHSDWNKEGISAFSQWDAMNEPQLPPEISK